MNGSPAQLTWTLISAILGLLASTACRPSHPSPALAPEQAPPTPRREWFEDITAAAQLAFLHRSGASGAFRMPEIMGSGCALFDCDNDGRLDIYLIQNQGPHSPAVNQLFRQQPDGTFKNASAGSGLDVAGFGMGAAVGDINNDGWNDLAVTEYGAVRLFLNRRQGTFQEITPSARLVHVGWATAAAFFDYDRDGWLDLVVGNYVDYDPTHQCYNALGELEYCGVGGVPVTVSRLYRNLGLPSTVSPLEGSPRFQDVTIPSGLVHRPGPALGVVCADFDGDHWPDILFADDERPNRLFMNQRDGTFIEEAASRGLAYTALGQVAANMGIGLGDVNRDGKFDVYITHLTQEFHNLWLQGPAGSFQDRTAEFGLTSSSWRGTGFGTVLADFNLDGYPDIALVNGAIKRDRYTSVPRPETSAIAPFWLPYVQRAQLFAHDGSGSFRDASEANRSFCGTPMMGRGLACGDVDNDGDLDLLTTGIDGPARLFRNRAPEPEAHWLIVRAVDPALGGRDALGAEIQCVAEGQHHWGLVYAGYSYLSSNDPRVHFGLGPAAQIDSIQVVWPDGQMEEFPGGAANRILLLSKGQGHPIVGDNRQ